MTGWRILQICLFIVTLSLTGLWVKDGFQVFTKDKSEKISIQKHEIFGTTIEKREWVEDFQFGLLPDDPLQPYRSLSFYLVVTIFALAIAQRNISKSSKASL